MATVIENLTVLRNEAAARRDFLTDHVKVLAANGSFDSLPEFVTKLHVAENEVRNFNEAISVAVISDSSEQSPLAKVAEAIEELREDLMMNPTAPMRNSEGFTRETEQLIGDMKRGVMRLKIQLSFEGEE